MPWTTVTALWPCFVETLCAHFPHFEPAAVRRFRGDRAKLVTYLAETHDLTLIEASETLADWFMAHGPAALEAQAA